MGYKIGYKAVTNMFASLALNSIHAPDCLAVEYKIGSWTKPVNSKFPLFVCTTLDEAKIWSSNIYKCKYIPSKRKKFANLFPFYSDEKIEYLLKLLESSLTDRFWDSFDNVSLATQVMLLEKIDLY